MTDERESPSEVGPNSWAQPVEPQPQPWRQPPAAWQQPPPAWQQPAAWQQPPPAWQPPPPAWQQPPPGWPQQAAWQPNPWQQQAWQQSAGARPGNGRSVLIGVVAMALVIAGLVTVGALTAHNDRSTFTSTDNGSSASGTVPAWTSPPDDGTLPVVPPLAVPLDGVTETSPVTATSGTQIYSDDFHDPGSGWATGRRALGSAGASATYSFSAAGYNAVVTGSYHYYAYLPFPEPVPQISVATTATQDAGAPRTGGFGVSCVANYGRGNEMRYEFLINNSGHWFIERRDGLPTDGSPSLLREGSAHAPGAAPISISAVCARLADGFTNRVMLFVNGTQVADLLDTASPDDGGWIGALMTTGGDSGPTTVHFSKVDENRLGSDTSGFDDTTPDDGTTPDGSGSNSGPDPYSQLGSST